MNSRFLVFLLLGATVIFTVEATRKPPLQRDQPSGVEEEDCEVEIDEYGNEYDCKGRPVSGSVKRYENINQEGTCNLESGKCPQGGWREFKRKNATVCLKLMVTPKQINFTTAGLICRKEANGRIMTVDSHEEFEWVHNNKLVGNKSLFSGWVWLAGYRNRKCQMTSCTDEQTAFNQVDGSSDHSYIYSRWEKLYNRTEFTGYLDNCLLLHADRSLEEKLINDHPCAYKNFNPNAFLCGITVM